MTTTDLQKHVQQIANDIELGLVNECCPHCGCDIYWTTDEYYRDCECGEEVTQTKSGYDYLDGVLDIQYIISSSKEYLGARLLVAFGGPNIWIDTHKKTVEGSWWGEVQVASYSYDEMGIDDACDVLFNS